MIMPSLTSTLVALDGSPLLLFAALFLLTFVLEDAIAVAAGLLAGRMLIDPVTALSALVLGTIAGDVALHAAGRWLADTALVRRLRSPAVVGVEGRLRQHGLIAVAIARFVPGTRLAVYLSSGLIRLTSGRTTLVIIVTTLLWTPALFYLSLGAGERVLMQVGPSSIILALVLVAAVLIGPRLLARHRMATA
jgi:membrane protein DedA with SNARE-associated domain